MNTLHLKYAVEVERTGSITQAAENLYMGQPNLSKAIMELEETLGFQILNAPPRASFQPEKAQDFWFMLKMYSRRLRKWRRCPMKIIRRSR